MHLLGAGRIYRVGVYAYMFPKYQNWDYESLYEQTASTQG